MARATDQVLARMVGEIEERQAFIDNLVSAADGNDLSDEQLELVTRARTRIEDINRQMGPLEEARRISSESHERMKSLVQFMSENDQKPKDVEYRSAGEYIIDMWKSGLGGAAGNDATRRLELYNRAASHQTTGDNPGLLPTPNPFLLRYLKKFM